MNIYRTLYAHHQILHKYKNTDKKHENMNISTTTKISENKLQGNFILIIPTCRKIIFDIRRFEVGQILFTAYEYFL